MSRFFLTDAPALSPGVCWITKTGVGPFIDTGIDLSKTVVDRGRMYISVDALREMAQIAGLFGETEPKTAALKRKQWYEEGYNAAIKELQNDVVNNFVERVLTDSAISAGAATLVESESAVTAAGAAVADVAEATAGESQNSSDVDEVERESASTGSVKRPASVSTNPSDESNFRL